MASIAVDPPPERLSSESIPAVDLRFLSQSELLALSRCSSNAFDLRRFDDVVIPKIDRSVFNESAGSRKQTYSRLRLAPRKPDIALKPRPPAAEPVPNDAERAENARIISLFKRLFNSDSQPEESSQLVPISVDFTQVTPVNPNAVAPVDEFAGGGGRKRKRRRKPESEKIKTLALTEAGVQSNPVVVYDNGDEGEKELVNKNGVVVDLVQLGRLEDPYGAEIRRRTEGLVGDEQLLGFMSRIGGQWGSRRRRRRIVDANELGDALPNGWKLIIAIKKKQGDAWLFCRRYISPKGKHFASCKEVSSYLMSLCGLQDMNCTSADQQFVAPAVVMKTTSKYAEDIPPKTTTAMTSFTTPSNKKENHLPPLENVYSGTLSGTNVFKCHKCSTPFCVKEGLLHHLLSCHKRKRRKAGEPIVDDVLKINGKYECQFCEKTFTERHCYFGHVGIHVKTYAKSIEGSPGTPANLNSNGPIATTGVPFVASEIQGSVVDVDAKTPHVPASDVPVISVQRNPVAGVGLELEAGNFNNQLNIVAQNGEQKRLASSQISLIEPVDKFDPLNKTNDALQKVADTSAGMLGTCSNVEKDAISDNEDDNVSESSRKMIIDDMVNHEVSGCKDEQTGIDESNWVVEQVGDGSIDDHVPTGMAVVHGDEIANEAGLSDEDCGTTRLMDNVEEVRFDVVLFEDTSDTNFESGSDNARTKMIVANDAQKRCPGLSALSKEEEETFGVEDSMNGVVESNIRNYGVERISEQSIFNPVDDMPTCVIETYVGNICIDSVKEPTSQVLNSQKDESTVDGGSYSIKEKVAESNVEWGVDGGSFVENEASIASSGVMPNTRGDEGSKLETFPPCFLDGNKSTGSALSNITLSRVEEPKSARGGKISGMMFASDSSDRDAASSLVTLNQQEGIFASLGRQSFADESNVFATCDNILEDSRRERVSKSILSCLSVSDHVHEMSNADNHVNAISAGNNTARPPELDKVDNSRNNEVILDFVGNMTEMNRSVLTSAQHGIMSETPSPFTLWNEQSYGAVQTHTGGYDDTREESRQGQGAQSDSLSLAGFQPNYGMGYNLNKSYIGKVDQFSRLDTFDHGRDTDLMIGFSSNEVRTNQHVATEDLWRSNDGRIVPGGLGNSSSSQAQVSGSFRGFDILMDKGQNELFSVNEKFDGLSSFEGLRSAAVEPMEFSFITGPSSSRQLEQPKVLPYNSAQMEQGFDSSLWYGKGAPVPNMIGGHVGTTMCVWCGNAFRLDPAAAETQAGSIGHLCPDCKSRISSQYM